MEFRESMYKLIFVRFEYMDYLIKQEDIMDLKMEENSDQYLFNSLLDIGALEQQSNISD